MSLDYEVRRIIEEEKMRLDADRPRASKPSDVIQAARMLGLDGMADAIEFAVRDNANHAVRNAVVAESLSDPQFPEWLALYKPGSIIVGLNGSMTEYTVLGIEVLGSGQIGAKVSYNGGSAFTFATFGRWKAGNPEFAPTKPKPEHVPTWIQTNQMVPDNEDPVLVLMDDGEVGVLRFDGGLAVRPWMTVSIGPRGIYDQNAPVAWRPIDVPRAPEAIRLQWEMKVSTLEPRSDSD